MSEHDSEMQTAWREAIAEIGAQTADQLNRRWGQGPGSLADPDAVGLILAWTFERSGSQKLLWRTVAYRETELSETELTAPDTVE